MNQFRRDWLPRPVDYYHAEGLTLQGVGAWQSTLCPFHDDHHPSLRINVDKGCFRCMACGFHGGDVLAFHMQRHGMHFIDAARALHAWEGE
ncbi:MAG: hypothetical protein GY782_08185 [Gammaproteobacteria bacterium]|nr:hypothetical protein [Gammaproteobacteria bacterium]